MGLLAVGLLARGASNGRWIWAAGWLMTAGILVFCGSLYALALSGYRGLGAVTPFGGTAFLLGWVALSIGILRLRTD